MMILARYEYYRPSTVEEAVSMLKRENTIIAGGSDVMPQLKTATIAPEALIDLSKISEMHTVEETDDGIYIGAMVTLSHLAKNELILRKLVALSQAARNVASPQIRNRGTVGGNLMQARRCFYYNQTKEWRRGIPVCMGTDAYTHDMLESLKVFLIIQRHNAAMPNVGWCEAMTMLFENNAKMASKYFDRKLGVLEAGAAADVIVMDYKPFTPLSEENIDGHMLFGMMGKNCRTTIINGRVLYKDREFVGIDEDKINAWTMAESKKLWSTLNDRTY